jgi:UV DNA damage repair endonuclease
MGRIGFCCKWIERPDQVNGIKPLDECKQYNTGSTTVAWLNRQSKSVAEQKLWDLMVQNIDSARRLVEKVSTLDENLKMVRLSSDILPVYTHSDWREFWRSSVVRHECERKFAQLGDLARKNNVRLSFHPGQFCVLASDSDDIVERSIEEFEYHTDMARWMGYGAAWHDHGFKINVHLSGRGGAAKFLQTLGRLSPEARNLITIENDENTNGLDLTLAVGKHVALVLDIHHHWVKTGEYIDPSDERVQYVIESWRGARPVLHYSVSREDILLDHDPGTRPDHGSLIRQGIKRQHLRAHSDFYWNTAVNEWALEFLPKFDIQCESKGKNLASMLLAAHLPKNVDVA